MIKRKKINHFDLQAVCDAAKIFSKYNSIFCVYLYGSLASGKETPLSDIDICYLSCPGLNYLTESDVAEELRIFLKTDEIDFSL